MCNMMLLKRMLFTFKQRRRRKNGNGNRNRENHEKYFQLSMPVLFAQMFLSNVGE